MSMKLTSDGFLNICREKVAHYTNEHIDKSDDIKALTAEDVYVVWYCKELQNHKALLSTPIPNGMYYEMTYNGDTDEIYFDAYKKWEHSVLKITSEEE